MQVPVYIGSYIYEDQTRLALIWETKKAKQSQTNRGKKITRKWQGNKMVYSEAEAPRNYEDSWTASCDSTLDDFKKAEKACKDDNLQLFHINSYNLADTNRFTRR